MNSLERIFSLLKELISDEINEFRLRKITTIRKGGQRGKMNITVILREWRGLKFIERWYDTWSFWHDEDSENFLWMCGFRRTKAHSTNEPYDKMWPSQVDLWPEIIFLILRIDLCLIKMIRITYWIEWIIVGIGHYI